jgi:hypothetical protein
MESCNLTRNIGSQTSGESNLSRFGVLDEVKPLLLKKVTMGQPKDCVVVNSPEGKVSRVGVCGIV